MKSRRELSKILVFDYLGKGLEAFGIMEKHNFFLLLNYIDYALEIILVKQYKEISHLMIVLRKNEYNKKISHLKPTKRPVFFSLLSNYLLLSSIAS